MFKKVNDTHYVCTEVNQIDTFVKEQLNIISNGMLGEFEDVLNSMLYENILSRYVSSLYVKEIGELNDKHHIMITININNTNYNITVGTFNVSDQMKYLNGIIEL